MGGMQGLEGSPGLQLAFVPPAVSSQCQTALEFWKLRVILPRFREWIPEWWAEPNRPTKKLQKLVKKLSKT